MRWTTEQVLLLLCTLVVPGISNLSYTQQESIKSKPKTLRLRLSKRSTMQLSAKSPSCRATAGR